jgi:hypothetical protein
MTRGRTRSTAVTAKGRVRWRGISDEGRWTARGDEEQGGARRRRGNRLPCPHVEDGRLDKGRRSDFEGEAGGGPIARYADCRRGGPAGQVPVGERALMRKGRCRAEPNPAEQHPDSMYAFGRCEAHKQTGADPRRSGLERSSWIRARMVIMLPLERRFYNVERVAACAQAKLRVHRL